MKFSQGFIVVALAFSVQACGMTIHEAVATGDIGTVKLLLNKGGDVNAKKRIPGDLMLTDNPDEIKKQMSSSGVQLTERPSGGYNMGSNGFLLEIRETPLHYAATRGFVDIAQLLIDKGADVNATDNNVTPLHDAAHYGHLGVARLLIDKGADVGSKNPLGYTPLHLAAEYGHVDVAQLLIDKGADVNATNNNGITPLMKAVKNDHKDVIELLEKHGAK